MKSPRLSKLGLALLGTLAALILAESLVRVLGLAPQLAAIQIDAPHASFVSSPDPILKYVPKPGVGEVNDRGFRDRSYAERKPAGTFRIVVVGDSIGFGYCNEQRAIAIDRIFANVLEDELNREGFAGHDRVEVLNLSVSGYDTLQEVEFLREYGLAYEPDAVLIAYCLNDVMRASRELHLFSENEEWEAYRATADRIYRGAIFRSHLVRFVWHRAPGLVERISGEAQSDDPAPGFERTVEGFRRVAEMSARSGFRTAVVIFPFFRDFERYTHGPIHASVTAEARRHGLHVLDLLPVFAEASSETSDLCAPCCEIHPNERGHALAAAAIADHLGSWTAD